MLDPHCTLPAQQLTLVYFPATKSSILQSAIDKAKATTLLASGAWTFLVQRGSTSMKELAIAAALGGAGVLLKRFNRHHKQVRAGQVHACCRRRVCCACCTCCVVYTASKATRSLTNPRKAGACSCEDSPQCNVCLRTALTVLCLTGRCRSQRGLQGCLAATPF